MGVLLSMTDIRTDRRQTDRQTDDILSPSNRPLIGHIEKKLLYYIRAYLVAHCNKYLMPEFNCLVYKPIHNIYKYVSYTTSHSLLRNLSKVTLSPPDI